MVGLYFENYCIRRFCFLNIKCLPCKKTARAFVLLTWHSRHKLRFLARRIKESFFLARWTKASFFGTADKSVVFWHGRQKRHFFVRRTKAFFWNGGQKRRFLERRTNASFLARWTKASFFGTADGSFVFWHGGQRRSFSARRTKASFILVLRVNFCGFEGVKNFFCPFLAVLAVFGLFWDLIFSNFSKFGN